LNFRCFSREAVAKHYEAERACDGNSTGSRICDFSHPALTNALRKRIVKPHPSAAGAAAGRLPPIAR
jgi:hypothetical protein